MSHEITESDTPIYAKVPAWHGLGTVLPFAPTPEEALTAAGLEWWVEQCPMYCIRELGTVGANTETVRIPVESHLANIRSDTGDILGVVTDGYQPYQNKELAQFILNVSEKNKDLIEIESAGSLKGGRKVWFLARTKSLIELGEGEKDVTHPYIMFSNGHDGSNALWVMPTMVRVVCNNTFVWAMREAEDMEAKGQSIAFRHTSSIHDRVEDARGVILNAINGVDAYANAAKVMAGTSIGGTGDVLDFFKDVYQTHWGLIPTQPKDKTEERQYKRAKDTVAKWLTNYENPRNTGSGLGGTAWAGLNAITEWADHDKISRGGDDGRILSNLWGTSNQIKQLAFDKATALCTA
jgi:phage/plasmid-like protein (TIGR03299 family)